MLTRRETIYKIETKSNLKIFAVNKEITLFSRKVFDKKYYYYKKSELTSMGTAVEAKRERSHTYGVYDVAEL